MKKRLLSKNKLSKFITLLFLITSFTSFAQITSTTTGGNWGETTTWVGGNIPTATDNVIIAAGATVNLNIGGACNNLTVNGSLVLNTISRSLIVTGTTTVNANGIINFTTTTNTTNLRSFNDIVVNAGGTWNSQSLTTITGNITNNGTFTTLTGNSITLTGENKTFSGADIKISNNVTITGSYTNNSTDLTFNGNLQGTGSLTHTANRTLYIMGATNSITTLNVSASPNTVIYGRLGTQTVNPTTYHDLRIEGVNSKSMQGIVTINNTLQINSGAIFYDNGFAINGTSGSILNIDGELQLGSAASPTALPTTFGTMNINTGSTIHYSSTNVAGQEVDHTKPYHHLRVSGTSVKRITGNVTLPGDLTITSGTLDVQNFNITVNRDVSNLGTQIGSGKIILSGAATTHQVRGNFTNLELNDIGGATMSGVITIQGTLHMTNGILRMNSLALTIVGNVSGDGQGLLFNGAFENGDLIILGTDGGSAGNIYMAPAPNNTLRYLTMNRTGNGASVNIANTAVIKQQWNLDNGNIVHNGNLTLGLTTNVLTTRIVNGTVASPPIFNTFTGAYRVQYGNATLLTQNLTTGSQGEIPVNNTVERIVLNNNTQFTISLSADITVTGTLTLTAGTLLLGDNNMTTTYAGAGVTGSVSSYIVTNGSGQFFRTIPAATGGSFNFPIGYSNGYSLANINFIDNTNMFAGRVGVRVVGIAPPVGETVNYLKKHWIFTDERQGGQYTYRPTFTFNNSEITGLGSALFVGRFNGTAWDVFPPSALTATTITMQTGSISAPLDGENVFFSALSEPLGEILPSTVWDIIVNSTDHTTLETAVLLAGLEGALQGDGPFTVFAPTDAAFAALPTGVFDSLTADPMGALADVLRYHVIGGSALESDQLTNGQTIVTLNGQSVTVSISGNNISINNSLITIRDLLAENGVVHVIDAVLIPQVDDTYINNLLSNKINIYPNPANESFFIDCFECANTSYEIMTIDGKVVRSGRLINEREQISKGDLSAGIYLVKIFNENSFSIKKIIMQ
jgi:hypothetical protein